MKRVQGPLRALAPEADLVGFFETKDFDCSHGSGLDWKILKSPEEIISKMRCF
jgi:hypothetical protein